MIEWMASPTGLAVAKMITGVGQGVLLLLVVAMFMRKI